MPRGLVLTQALEDWTRRCFEQAGRQPGAAEPFENADTHPFAIEDADMHLRRIGEIAQREMRKHAAAHNASVLFLSLPGRVVARVCSYLSLSDRIVLSHLARDLRSRLVNTPDIWCNLRLHNLLVESYTPAALQELVRRSDPLPIQLALWIDDENYGSILSTLSANVMRLSSLTLHVHVPDHESECTPAGCWQSTLGALLNAAPVLEELRIRALEQLHFEDPEPEIFWILRRSPLHLPPSFLAGYAPMLRTCTIECVRLPILPTSGAFGALTCFDIHLGHDGHFSDVAYVFPMLPALETLAIRAYSMEVTLPRTDDQSAAAELANLKNLLLRVTFTLPSEALLCRVLPFSTIRHFDVMTGQPAPLVDAAYPRGFKTLVAGLSACTLSAVDDTGAKAVTVRIYDFSAVPPAPYTMLGLATVTWLALDEIVWGDVMQLIPRLPAVAALHIRLGSCQDVRDNAPFDGRQGIFYLEPGFVWRVPFLKELKFYAPSTCKADATLCTCRAPMSVSLLDLAAFIHEHLAFEAAALDRVRLSGFSIIDPDFCSAWLQLRACANDIDWVEQPEIIPHMDVPSLQDGFQVDLRTHFSGRDL